MKIHKIFLLLILILIAGSFVFAEEEGNDAVAEVNGVKITMLDVDREINMMYQQAIMQGTYPDDSKIEEYRQQAVNTLIGRELLIQDAEKKNYAADQAAVDEYMEALAMNYGGKESLEQTLAGQGMSLDKLRTDTERYQIVSNYVENEIRSGIEVAGSDARSYYDENREYFRQEETVRASHILIQTPEDADEEELKAAYDKISDIREQIVEGADFSELAREYSDCPSAENGGDLGEFGPGRMVPPFDRAVFSMKPGELSKPVQTQFGFHLIKLVEKNDGKVIEYDDVKNQITDYLTDLEVQAEVSRIVVELRNKAEIKLF